MGIFTRRSRATAPPSDEPLTRPRFDRTYLGSILDAVGVTPSELNLLHLAQRSAFVLGCQGAAYTAQARDRQAFEEFVDAFSSPPAQWLDVVDAMAGWLWEWSSFCHEALVRQADDWARLCAEPGGFISRDGVEPWNEGQNRAPSDDRDAWELVYQRNAGR